MHYNSMTGQWKEQQEKSQQHKKKKKSSTGMMICYYKAERLSILVSAYMKGFLHVSQLYTDCTSFVAIEKLM